MSNPEVNSSAVTPQHSIITSTTSEDEIQNNLEASKDSADREPNVEDSQHNQSLNKDNVSESDNYVVRSESVIKSPSKALFVSSSTPVIKVMDSSQEFSEKENNNEVKRSIGASVIAQTPSQCASSQNSISFLHSATNPTLANPFLRTSSLSSNFFNSPDNSDLNSDNSFSFAPSKLLSPFSSNNPFEASTTERPSVLRAADSNAEAKVTETISTSKTFISLNKEDIGKIKTPAFIKNSLEKSTSNFSNGSSSNNKETDYFNNTDDTQSNYFTFGQNLQDRVVFDCKPSTAADLKAEINSTSDNLISFSDVTSFEASKDNSSDSIKSDDSKSENELSSSALKNGDSSDGVFKRKYEVITGEEDEQNVLSIHGKLYAWDADKINWIEKGRGHLRLNDVIKNERLCSRLVMRTSGVLRVILNAHVVAGMKVELANDNCLRFTNVDGIYLIKANPKDIDQLNSAIEYRLREITKRIKVNDETDAQDDDEDADNSASVDDSI